MLHIWEDFGKEVWSQSNIIHVESWEMTLTLAKKPRSGKFFRNKDMFNKCEYVKQYKSHASVGHKMIN